MNYSRSDVDTIVFDTVARFFSVDRESLCVGTAACDVPGWDSLASGLFLMSLEDRLDRELPIDIVSDADNIGALSAMVQQAVGARA